MYIFYIPLPYKFKKKNKIKEFYVNTTINFDLKIDTSFLYSFFRIEINVVDNNY